MDSENKKAGKIKRYFFNIYWKKNLLFLIIFAISAFAPLFLFRNFNEINVMGLPIPYYDQEWRSRPSLFSPMIFVFDVLFWYAITTMIATVTVKQPKEISKNVVKLNYITLGIILLVMFFHLLPLISESQIVMI